MLAKLTKHRVVLLFLALAFSLPAISQKRISGKITGPDGKPLYGATVSVKGTNIGSSTAEDGRFTIEMPSATGTLIVSYVGYEVDEVTVDQNTNPESFNVTMRAVASNLNEVVVVGYSAQRKKDITAAVSVVNVADLKSQPTIDAASQLQGRASGVTVTQNGVPGASAQVRIRGLGSFNNNNPLYVIDGVQSGSINGLNPNDIESMQVLKDAASVSIYGVRGSNGVILVTTKKGKRRGVNVNVDSYVGVQDPGKGFDLLNAQEEAELTFLARRNSGLVTTGSVYGNGANPVLPDYIFATGAANGTLLNNGDPLVNPDRYSLDLNQLGNAGYSPTIIVPASKGGTNWYNAITRNAPIQSHNVSVSGSGENSRYLLSLNYFDQRAITEHQFYKRYTIRMNSEFNVHRAVRVGQNLQLFSSEANAPGNSNVPGNNDEGSVIAQTFRPMAIIPVYTIRPGDFAGTLGGSGFGTWGNAKNPLAILYRNRNNRNNNVNIFGNVYAEVDFARHFTLRSSFGGSMNTANNWAYPFIEYEHVENNANTTYNESFIRNWNWILTNMLTYKNSFGKHDVSAFVGQEAQKGGGRQIIGAATSFFTYNYLPYINLSNGNVQNLGGSTIFTQGTLVSYFARADYAYDGKYLLSATVRRDGTSKFRPDYQYGTFPAFSLGWRISDESFMKSISWLNDLKLRGSWGKMGNELAVQPTNAFTTFGSNRQSSWYDINGTQNSPVEGFFLERLGNPLGFWEESITTNVGFDATILNNTTDIVFDWYQKKTDDLLYNPIIEGIRGSSIVPFQNVGSMKNNGIDLMITNRARIGEVKLTTTGTFTTYNNKITAINGTQQFFDFNSTVNEANRIGGNATRNFLNNPYNTFYGYKVIGIFQSDAEVSSAPTQTGAGPGRFRYQDTNGDKIINADDRTIIGDPNPDFTYGLNLAAEYKNFDISAFFYGVAGKDVFNTTRWWTDFSAGFPGGRSKRALYDSWLPDGSRPNAGTPIQETTLVEAGFSTSGVVNSYYVENGSYLRLRNLQIGYTLPLNIISRAKMSKARIYLQAANLFTITKYTGLDPDVVNGDDRATSVDVGAYPTVRQYLLGVNITF